MDIDQFIEEGYLHEVNRRFFHPLGLALVVSAETDDETGEQTTPWEIKGIWDARDDPEGILFDGESLDSDKAERIRLVEESRRPAREERLGYWVQPVDKVT